MSDLAFLSMILGTSAAAGVLGALLGLGGGILLVPLLTLFFGVSLPYAMGASILSVIATSCGAADGHQQLHDRPHGRGERRRLLRTRRHPSGDCDAGRAGRAARLVRRHAAHRPPAQHHRAQAVPADRALPRRLDAAARPRAAPMNG